jgi:hypothetical protein
VYKKAGKRVKRTGWHQLEAWDDLARYISKYAVEGQKMIARVYIRDAYISKMEPRFISHFLPLKK